MSKNTLPQYDTRQTAENQNELKLAKEELIEAISNRNGQPSGFFVKEIGIANDYVYKNLGVNPQQVLKTITLGRNDQYITTIYSTNFPDTTLKTIELTDPEGNKNLTSRSIKVVSTQLFEQSQKDNGFT